MIQTPRDNPNYTSECRGVWACWRWCLESRITVHTLVQLLKNVHMSLWELVILATEPEKRAAYGPHTSWSVPEATPLDNCSFYSESGLPPHH